MIGKPPIKDQGNPWSLEEPHFQSKQQFPFTSTDYQTNMQRKLFLKKKFQFYERCNDFFPKRFSKFIHEGEASGILQNYSLIPTNITSLEVRSRLGKYFVNSLEFKKLLKNNKRIKCLKLNDKCKRILRVSFMLKYLKNLEVLCMKYWDFDHLLPLPNYRLSKIYLDIHELEQNPDIKILQHFLRKIQVQKKGMTQLIPFSLNLYTPNGLIQTTQQTSMGLLDCFLFPHFIFPQEFDLSLTLSTIPTHFKEFSTFFSSIQYLQLSHNMPKMRFKINNELHYKKEYLNTYKRRIRLHFREINATPKDHIQDFLQTLSGVKVIDIPNMEYAQEIEFLPLFYAINSKNVEALFFNSFLYELVPEYLNQIASNYPNLNTVDLNFYRRSKIETFSSDYFKSFAPLPLTRVSLSCSYHDDIDYGSFLAKFSLEQIQELNLVIKSRFKLEEIMNLCINRMPSLKLLFLDAQFGTLENQVLRKIQWQNFKLNFTDLRIQFVKEDEENLFNFFISKINSKTVKITSFSSQFRQIESVLGILLNKNISQSIKNLQLQFYLLTGQNFQELRQACNAIFQAKPQLQVLELVVGGDYLVAYLQREKLLSNIG